MNFIYLLSYLLLMNWAFTGTIRWMWPILFPNQTLEENRIWISSWKTIFRAAKVQIPCFLVLKIIPVPIAPIYFLFHNTHFTYLNLCSLKDFTSGHGWLPNHQTHFCIPCSQQNAWHLNGTHSIIYWNNICPLYRGCFQFGLLWGDPICVRLFLLWRDLFLCNGVKAMQVCHARLSSNIPTSWSRRRSKPHCFSGRG